MNNNDQSQDATHHRQSPDLDKFELALTENHQKLMQARRTRNRDLKAFLKSEEALQKIIKA